MTQGWTIQLCKAGEYVCIPGIFVCQILPEILQVLGIDRRTRIGVAANDGVIRDCSSLAILQLNSQKTLYQSHLRRRSHFQKKAILSDYRNEEYPSTID